MKLDGLNPDPPKKVYKGPYQHQKMSSQKSHASGKFVGPYEFPFLHLSIVSPSNQSTWSLLKPQPLRLSCHSGLWLRMHWLLPLSCLCQFLKTLTTLVLLAVSFYLTPRAPDPALQSMRCTRSRTTLPSLVALRFRNVDLLFSVSITKLASLVTCDLNFEDMMADVNTCLTWLRNQIDID